MKNKEFFRPQDVTTPKLQWKLIKVLHEGSNDGGGYSIAAGSWDDQSVIAMRWNPCEGRPLGNPQSRGLPTWFIVPEALNKAIISTLDPSAKTYAENFLS